MNEFDIDAEFGLFIMQNGHEHTFKAFGEYYGDPCDNDMFSKESVLNYYNRVCEKENTYLAEIITASSEEEAIEKCIILSDGGLK